MKKIVLILLGLGVAGYFLAGKKKDSNTDVNNLIDNNEFSSNYNNKIFGVTETGQWFVTNENKRFYATEKGVEMFLANNPGANIGMIALSEVQNLPIVGHIDDNANFIVTGNYPDPV